MKLKEITLLSAEEYEQYRSLIPPISRGWWSWWWLRSPGKDQDCAAFVYGNGDIDLRGDDIDDDWNIVRPALLINLEISDSLFWYKPEKLIGTKIKYGEYNWTVLDSNLGKLYVLCDVPIAKLRFDAKSNNWNRSELKQWLETEGLKLIAGEEDGTDDR